MRYSMGALKQPLLCYLPVAVAPQRTEHYSRIPTAHSSWKLMPQGLQTQYLRPRQAVLMARSSKELLQWAALQR